MTSLLITVAVIALFSASIVLHVVVGVGTAQRRDDGEREPEASPPPLPRQFDWAAFERGFSRHMRSLGGQREDHPT